MTGREVQPPEFIRDLLGEVLGERLACWTTGQHQCSVRVGVEDPTGEAYEGLFFDLDSEYGVHHLGTVWEIYSGGRPRLGHAWDDNEEDQFADPLPFREWLRGEVSGLARGRSSHVVLAAWRRLAEQLPPSPGVESEALRTELAEALEVGERYGAKGRSWFEGGRVAELLLRGQTEEDTALAVAELLPKLEGRLYEPATDWAKFLMYGARLHSERELPPGAKDRIGEEVGWVFDGMDEGMPPPRLQEYCARVAVCAEPVRRAFSSAFVAQARDPMWLHMLAAELRAVPSEMVPPLEAALELEPEDTTILSALLGAYREAGRPEDAEAVRVTLDSLTDDAEEATAVDSDTPSDADVQGWIDAYSRLAAEFSASSPRRKGDPDARGKTLIELEARLNTYWRTHFANRLDQCVQQGRFLSSGSSGYVGWLRNEERYQEAVDHLAAQLRDDELNDLRFRTHRYAFEVLVNNGLGSCVDSGDEEHLQIGVELVNRVDAFPMESSDVLYQVACVLARAGDVDRALVYAERAVAAGESAQVMARDTDLAAIHDHERFRRLLERE
ncbi:MAG: hypothetical protein AAF799_45595 [Myxococcota bacterium]